MSFQNYLENLMGTLKKQEIIIFSSIAKKGKKIQLVMIKRKG